VLVAHETSQPPSDSSAPPPSGEDRHVAARIGRVRGYRVRERDLTIADSVERARRSVRTLTRAESEAARAWEVCTEGQPWAQRCAFVSTTRGVLSVKAFDSSVKYLAEVWLRAGGEKALRTESKVAVKKVRVGT
jgi:hypothetical protein